MSEEFSTKTIIAYTNILIDIERFFYLMPIYDLGIECKNTRKKRMKDLYHIDDKVEELPDGSIICLKWNNKTRGMVLKTASVVRNNFDQKKKRDKYFLNSVTTNLFFKQEKNGVIQDKLVNIKITKTGKFQITGCKNDDLAVRAIHFLYKTMLDVKKWTGCDLFSLSESIQGFNTRGKCNVILQTVMKNRNVNIGFAINREKLDMLINKEYENYLSIFDGTTSGAGVNIKIPIDENDEEDLYLCELAEPGEVSRRVIERKEIPNLVIKLKEGYHTFLCFKSGSCIHSGRGKFMSKTFSNFLEILQGHREHLEEK
jgi:TATA-box binding protein (TBP) (component of TFIID and TFIIIB)